MVLPRIAGAASALLWLAAGAAATPGAAPTAEVCDPGHERPAATLIEPALLSGPHHRVRPCARIAGHLAVFVLDTPWGALAAESRELLALRVEELPALARLQATGAGELALAAARARGERGALALGRLLVNPLDTAARLPIGALRYFRAGVAQQADRARRLGDRARDALTDGDEAYGRLSLRPGVAPAPAVPRSGADRLGRELRKQGLDALSWGRQRRTWARRLGVEPYTGNPLIRSELDRLAWAAVLGDRAAALALDALGAAPLVGEATRLDDWVWDLEPEAIGERSRQRLAALGCGGAIEIRRLLRNGRWNPPLQVALVDVLVDLDPRRGCVDLVELAAAVRTEVEARYLVNALRLLPHDGERGPAIRLVGTAPAAHYADGRVLLPLPVDVLRWTAATRAFFDHPDWRVPNRTALIAGDASVAAQRGLSRRGWSLVFGARARAPFAAE